MLGAKVIEAARSKLHVKEDDGSNKDKAGEIAKFWEAAQDSRFKDWFGYTPGVEHRNEWCCAFASWCYREAGRELKHAHGSGFTGCGLLIMWLDKQGAWRGADSDYEPQAGDMIFIDWKKRANGFIESDVEITAGIAHDNVQHIGLVTSYDAERDIIHTIEGNLSSGVTETTRSFDSGRVLGFGSAKALENE